MFKYGPAVASGCFGTLSPFTTLFEQLSLPTTSKLGDEWAEILTIGASMVAFGAQLSRLLVPLKTTDLKILQRQALLISFALDADDDEDNDYMAKIDGFVKVTMPDFIPDFNSLYRPYIVGFLAKNPEKRKKLGQLAQYVSMALCAYQSLDSGLSSCSASSKSPMKTSSEYRPSPSCSSTGSPTMVSEMTNVSREPCDAVEHHGGPAVS